MATIKPNTLYIVDEPGLGIIHTLQRKVRIKSLVWLKNSRTRYAYKIRKLIHYKSTVSLVRKVSVSLDSRCEDNHNMFTTIVIRFIPLYFSFFFFIHLTTLIIRRHSSWTWARVYNDLFDQLECGSFILQWSL